MTNAFKKWRRTLAVAIAVLVWLVVICFVFVSPLKKVVQTWQWSEVPCQIVSSWVEVSEAGRTNCYRAAVIYQYQVDGRDFKGTRFKPVADSSGKYYRSEEMVERFPSGAKVSCFVDPLNPAASVLVQGQLLDLSLEGMGIAASTLLLWMLLHRTPTTPSSWASGVLVFSNKGKVVVLWVFTSALLAFWGLCARLNPDWSIASPIVALLVSLGLLVIWIGLGALSETLRYRRFGKSIFKVSKRPVFVGGVLEGIIELERLQYQDASRFALLLRLVEFSFSKEKKQRSMRVLWEQQRVVESHGNRLPITFILPHDGHETTLLFKGDFGCFWQLDVEPLDAPADYSARFVIPVSSGKPSEAESLLVEERRILQERELAESPLPKPREFSFQRTEESDGSIAFIFPGKRGWKLRFTIAIASFCFFSALVIFAILRRAADALLLLVCFAGVIGVPVAIFYFYTVRVVVSGSGIVVVSRYLGIPFVRRIPREEIEVIKAHQSIGEGLPSFTNTVQILGRSGKVVAVVGNIERQSEAKWLASELSRLIGSTLKIGNQEGAA